MATPKIDDLASRQASACPSPLPVSGASGNSSQATLAQPTPLEVPKLEDNSSRNGSSCSIQRNVDSRRSSHSRLVASKPKPGALKLLFAQDVSSDWWLESQLLFVRRLFFCLINGVLVQSRGLLEPPMLTKTTPDDAYYGCARRCDFHPIPCFHYKADRCVCLSINLISITNVLAKATFSISQFTSSPEKTSPTKSRKPSPYPSSGKTFRHSNNTRLILINNTTQLLRR